MRKILLPVFLLFLLTGCQPLLKPTVAPNGSPIIQPGDRLYNFSVVTKDSNGASRRNTINVHLIISSPGNTFVGVHIDDGYEGGQFFYGPMAVASNYVDPIHVEFSAHFPWISVGDTVSCAVTKRGQESPIAANTLRVDRGTPEFAVVNCDTTIYP